MFIVGFLRSRSCSPTHRYPNHYLVCAQTFAKRPHVASESPPRPRGKSQGQMLWRRYTRVHFHCCGCMRQLNLSHPHTLGCIRQLNLSPPGVYAAIEPITPGVYAAIEPIIPGVCIRQLNLSPLVCTRQLNPSPLGRMRQLNLSSPGCVCRSSWTSMCWQRAKSTAIWAGCSIADRCRNRFIRARHLL